MWGNTEQDKAEQDLFSLTNDISRMIDDFYCTDDIKVWMREFEEICLDLITYKIREEQYLDLFEYDEDEEFREDVDFSSFTDKSWKIFIEKKERRNQKCEWQY